MKRKICTNFLAIFLTILLGVQISLAQTVYTFEDCGATGQNGPNQTQINTTYASTTLAGFVTSSSGIQLWTVPATGSYSIEAWGAQGYGAFGGRGAYIKSEHVLTAGTILKILVGQKAPPPVGSVNQYAGGGGSFVTTNTNTPLVVAGGGGGNHGTAFVTSADASIATGGNTGAGANSGIGGTAGSGGATASSADGGGGLLGVGGGVGGGGAYVNGGIGGKGITAGHGEGGFGCGGGTSSWDNYRAGGGGGYSGGGGAGENGQINAPAGGGGGSFNSGTAMVATAGVQIGDGKVIIKSLATYPNDAGIQSLIGISETSCAGSHSLIAMVKNYGNNQINSITVGWSIDGTSQTSQVATSLIDTSNGTGPDTLAVTLGTFALTAATVVKVWTTLPNNVADPSNVNDTIELNIVKPLTLVTSVFSQLKCNGDGNGAVAVSITGGKPPYTRMWSTGSSQSVLPSLSAGTYSVVVTDGYGCEDSASIELTEPPALALSVVVSNVSAAGNDGAIDLTVGGGTPPYTHTWSNSATTEDISGLQIGTYQVVVTDSEGCTDTLDVTLTSSIGIGEYNTGIMVDIYPNPTLNGEFTVLVPNANGELSIEVTNMLGERVLFMENAMDKTTVRLDESSGIYLVRISDGFNSSTKRLNVGK